VQQLDVGDDPGLERPPTSATSMAVSAAEGDHELALRSSRLKLKPLSRL
jgi:hypothetical protein